MTKAQIQPSSPLPRLSSHFSTPLFTSTTKLKLFPLLLPPILLMLLLLLPTPVCSGGSYCSDLVFRAAHRADLLPQAAQHLMPDNAQGFATLSAELSRDAWASARAQHAAKLRLALQPDITATSLPLSTQPPPPLLGTFLISIAGVCSLAQVLQPMVEDHLAASNAPTTIVAEELLQQQQQQAQQQKAGSKAEQQTSDLRFLSVRQLGLAFGLLFFQVHTLAPREQHLATQVSYTGRQLG